MKIFTAQTDKDLEFDTIRNSLSVLCQSEAAQKRGIELVPIKDWVQLEIELERTKEYIKIYAESERIPAFDAYDIEKELDMLTRKNSTLPAESFILILSMSVNCNELLSFFNQKKLRFPVLHKLTENITYTKDLINAINLVFDINGEVKNEASSLLSEIRDDITVCKNRISRSFDREMKKYFGKNYLAEYKESFINDRRVLAVVSSYKRQISGITHGSSKTGSIIYIEPQSIVPLSQELVELRSEEQKEVFRILNELTTFLSQFLPLIQGYYDFLIELDFVRAKYRLANQYKGSVPKINDDSIVDLKEAIHPILYIKNQELGIATMPQDIKLDKFNRILVISGPNAGGKSISLKTVGIIQLMVQSGLAVPIHENSSICLFEAVLTDIGDNQSIENQLSTYSYRLKRMKEFLEITNKKTLLLLDEFGTGSDPELGGALAEVIFEQLYSKKAFGVITTHYNNIKIKASQLQNAVNGCMLFNEETLEPLFKLDLGHPGSSFTFEVAEKNGIPIDLINKAKEKLDTKQVSFDKLIVELQKEKAKHERLHDALSKAEIKATQAEKESELKKNKFEERLLTQSQMIEKNNHYLTKGQKMHQFIQRFALRKKNSELLEDLVKFLKIEKTKIVETQKKEELKVKSQTKKGKKVLKPSYKQEKIKIDSTVRLLKSKQKGTVVEVKEDKVIVNFGVFRTTVDLKQLEFIK